MTREILIAGIVQEPAEEAPRLVYADWSEENNEPERAELTTRSPATRYTNGAIKH
jgi:uncharacterized protein (TIGR02996 family)